MAPNGLKWPKNYPKWLKMAQKLHFWNVAIYAFCQAQIFCCQAPKTILHPCYWVPILTNLGPHGMWLQWCRRGLVRMPQVGAAYQVQQPCKDLAATLQGPGYILVKHIFPLFGDFWPHWTLKIIPNILLRCDKTSETHSYSSQTIPLSGKIISILIPFNKGVSHMENPDQRNG